MFLLHIQNSTSCKTNKEGCLLINTLDCTNHVSSSFLISPLIQTETILELHRAKSCILTKKRFLLSVTVHNLFLMAILTCTFDSFDIYIPNVPIIWKHIPITRFLRL